MRFVGSSTGKGVSLPDLLDGLLLLLGRECLTIHITLSVERLSTSSQLQRLLRLLSSLLSEFLGVPFKTYLNTNEILGRNACLTTTHTHTNNCAINTTHTQAIA